MTETRMTETRMTEIYDGYLDSYHSVPVPPVSSPSRMRARSNPASRSGSSNSGYAQIGGLMRRKSSRRANPRTYSRAQSTYEEEEEGYGSGEYDDGPIELSLIRVKVCSLIFIFGEFFFLISFG